MSGLRAKRVRSRVGARVAGPNATACFSQEGEDLILARMFEGREPGFFVDVGAHDPHRFSNTYLLYLRGWRGINVDPLPGMAEAFSKARPRDTSLEVALGAEPGVLTYHRFSDDALNTFDADRARWLIEHSDYTLVATTDVPIRTLDDVLAEHLPPEQRISLLTIDVEGLEEKVFAGFDLERHRPEIICVEDLGEGDLQSPTGVVAMLISCGYVMFASTNHSRFLRSDRRR